MRFGEAIDRYIKDMQLEGRLNSRNSIKKYRSSLEAHRRDVGDCDPARVNREGVKRTLGRWSNPNTRGYNRSILVSFYDWATHEGICEASPARQTRPPRRRPVVRVRLTEGEASRMLKAAEGTRERRAIYLGLCVGVRNAELRGLQGRHFGRKGFVWVSSDIAKGGRERWVPVAPDLAPVAAEIRQHVREEDYVLPALGFHPPRSTYNLDMRGYPSSTQALRHLVGRVARRAGITIDVTPHVLRHAYAERVGCQADARVVQHLLGHARLDSTEVYLGTPTLDQLAGAVRKVRYRSGAR